MRRSSENDSDSICMHQGKTKVWLKFIVISALDLPEILQQTHYDIC